MDISAVSASGLRNTSAVRGLWVGPAAQARAAKTGCERSGGEGDGNPLQGSAQSLCYIRLALFDAVTQTAIRYCKKHTLYFLS